GMTCVFINSDRSIIPRCGQGFCSKSLHTISTNPTVKLLRTAQTPLDCGHDLPAFSKSSISTTRRQRLHLPRLNLIEPHIHQRVFQIQPGRDLNQPPRNRLQAMIITALVNRPPQQRIPRLRNTTNTIRINRKPTPERCGALLLYALLPLRCVKLLPRRLLIELESLALEVIDILIFFLRLNNRTARHQRPVTLFNLAHGHIEEVSRLLRCPPLPSILKWPSGIHRRAIALDDLFIG